ncbi:hypothetical protein F2Q69_00025509 [Brassica cretica]|uniref:Uncharacterized protein n=1 Tax=Brassica cretica TaxID=69181 RepID=A0A8S9Q835_BRACR|nr:hypothetical protein F2Q69_00025509 [Brassica cretica]
MAYFQMSLMSQEVKTLKEVLNSVAAHIYDVKLPSHASAHYQNKCLVAALSSDQSLNPILIT